MKWLGFGWAVLLCVAGCGETPSEPTPAPAPAAVTAPAPEKVETAAATFFAGFQQADTVAMAKCYAPQVVLMGGSELLKKPWGLSPDGDRTQSVTVEREKLMGAYAELFKQAGVDRWKAMFAKFNPEQFTYHEPSEFGQQFAAAQDGDVLVLVPRGDGDDKAAFVFRKDANGHWLIVMELTDY